jgi:spore germination protein YaaH
MSVIANRPQIPSEMTELLTFCKLNNIQVYPTIGVGSAELPQTELGIGANRTPFIYSIVSKVLALGVDGVDLNIEILNQSHRQTYSAFIQALATALHGVNKKLIVTVAGKNTSVGTWGATASEDHHAIGQVADYVRVMCYGATTSLPVEQVESWIDYTLGKVSKSKVFLGNPYFDSAELYTEQMITLVNSKGIHGLCGWALQDGFMTQADFDMIATILPPLTNGETQTEPPQEIPPLLILAVIIALFVSQS